MATTSSLAQPIPRRQFLAGNLAAVAAGGFIGPAQHARATAASVERTGFIDAHSHIWTPDTERFPLGKWATPDQMQPSSFTAEQLLALIRPSGVDRVVLIQHGPFYGDDNSYMIDAAARFPGRFSIVAMVDERRPDLREQLQTLKQQGVRGLRIVPARYADRTPVAEPKNWLQASTMQQLWKLATELDLVICPLISADFLPTLPPMLRQFPTTTVALDHFAHIDLAKPAEWEGLRELATFRHMHIKASGYYKFGDQRAPYTDLIPLLKQVIDTYGAERVMWGSDCPYQLLNGNTFHDSVALIERELHFLDATARMAILRDNTQRLFFS